MDEKMLEDALAVLRLEKSDNQYYEVKSAHGGMPHSVCETISAFANTPGGGILILGVDESLGFNAVGVYNPKQCQQSLANYAKKEFSVLVDLRTKLMTIDEKPVVWVEVREADKTLKPVTVKSSGKTYIRYYDGDFELSEQEKQLFIASRGSSHFDESAVPESGSADLDSQLVSDYIANRKAHSRALSGMTDPDVLFRTGVTNRDGCLTAAGAVALGIYPQQFFPNYSIKVSAQKKRGLARGLRAININSIDGPIPMLLEDAVKWVENNSDEITVDLPNGHVRTVREYPTAVVRELVSNALIHRDMNPVSMFQGITLIIEDDRLVISNPGGLYGISVRELGRTGSKTRNARLAEICQYIQIDDGSNVLEKLGSGIPRIIEELSSLNMPLPRFIDGGIYFTAILKSGKYYRNDNVDKQSASGGNESRLLLLLAASPCSRNKLQDATGLTSAQIRYSLEKLIKAGKVIKAGNGSSPNTVYALASD
jgi:ATP-dependent DNA helicase RecG